jgi:ABC-type oligopeptide transport system substrate-binding subunit/transcriptional regulator with XRE-family HTH domain
MGTPAGPPEQVIRASFGALVRRHRRALDVTQAALARRVACSTATIKKIEHDERRPSTTMAHRLVEALEVPEDQREMFVAVGTGEVAAVRYDAAPAGAAAPAHTSTVVGRDAELRRLDRHLDGVLRAGARLVFVAGEAGQGKTALVTAFAERAGSSHPELIVARGFGTTANGVGDTYLLFRDVFRQLAGMDLDSVGLWVPSLQDRIRSFAPFVTAAIARLGTQLADLLLPGFQIDAVPASSTLTGSRDQLMGQVVEVIRTLAAQRPLLLFLDDLQWSDATSLDLLFHLHRRLQAAPVLLLGAYRTSEVVSDAPAATALRRLAMEAQRSTEDAVVDLGALDQAAARRLSDAILDIEPNRFDDEIRSRLFWQTRGQPLFLLELVRELRGRGDLVRTDGGSWTAVDGIDWARMPRRIAVVIAQRLDRADAEERAVLDVAAVEGETFTAEVVAHVLDLDPLDVIRILDRIAGVHGLVRDAGSDRTAAQAVSRYRFSHVLFQQYLYDALGQGQRRHLHARVGEELEALHAGDLRPVVARLAHHFDRAEDPARAAAWSLRAGDQARVVYAHDEAILHYRRAVEILRATGDPEHLARVLMKLGLSHQIAFDHHRAQMAYDEAFRLWATVLPASATQTQATLRMIWREPPSLDPVLGGYNTTAPILTQLLSGLVAWGEDNEILPDVAASWTLEDDGRRMVFHLRDDVRWHDGAEVTAHDFATTYRRAVEPSTGAPVAASLLQPVVGVDQVRGGQDVADEAFGVRALDDHTLVIELEEPTSWFLHNLAYYVLLPTPRHVVAAHGSDWASAEHFVGNGPFQLGTWDHGRSMALVRNPAYHGPAGGNVGRVELDLAMSLDEVGAAYDRDQIDVMTSFHTPSPVLAAARRRHPDEDVRIEAFITLMVWFDLARPPMHDRRVRHALSLAIDRASVAREVFQGMAEPAGGGIVPAGMPGHVPGLTPAGDPDAARALLEEAACSGDEVVVATSERDRVLGRFLQRSWDAVGLQVRHDIVTPTSNPDAHVWTGGWIADYPDPDTFLRVFVDPTNTPGWPSQRYIHLLDDAARVTEQGRRLELYEQAERILAEQALVLPLVYQPWHVLMKPWVTNLRVPAIKHPGFWHDLRVGQVTPR